MLLVGIQSHSGSSSREYTTTIDRVVAHWDPFQDGSDGSECSGPLELAHTVAMLDGRPFALECAA